MVSLFHNSTILNLTTTASDAEIRERYRSLAVIYHPDRNQDPAHKEAAERHFREIQRAYEILMNPQKRAVYDLLGEEGLKTNWEVGRRLRTPEQVSGGRMKISLLQGG
jgi:DnaJ homolog subfamily C member 11